MNLNLTGNHIHITPAIRDYVVAKLEQTDGIKTLFLVSRRGSLLDLIDIHDWSRGSGRCALASNSGTRHSSRSAPTRGDARRRG